MCERHAACLDHDLPCAVDAELQQLSLRSFWTPYPTRRGDAIWRLDGVSRDQSRASATATAAPEIQTPNIAAALPGPSPNVCMPKNFR
jgi:hypothetical protein